MTSVRRQRRWQALKFQTYRRVQPFVPDPWGRLCKARMWWPCLRPTSLYLAPRFISDNGPGSLLTPALKTRHHNRLYRARISVQNGLLNPSTAGLGTNSSIPSCPACARGSGFGQFLALRQHHQAPFGPRAMPLEAAQSAAACHPLLKWTNEGHAGDFGAALSYIEPIGRWTALI